MKGDGEEGTYNSFLMDSGWIMVQQANECFRTRFVSSIINRKQKKKIEKDRTQTEAFCLGKKEKSKKRILKKKKNKKINKISTIYTSLYILFSYLFICSILNILAYLYLRRVQINKLEKVKVFLSFLLWREGMR